MADALPLRTKLKEYRCSCGRLLFKSPGFTGLIEIKCRRCGLVRAVSAKKPATGHTTF